MKAHQQRRRHLQVLSDPAVSTERGLGGEGKPARGSSGSWSTRLPGGARSAFFDKQVVKKRSTTDITRAEKKNGGGCYKSRDFSGTTVSLNPLRAAKCILLQFQGVCPPKNGYSYKTLLPQHPQHTTRGFPRTTSVLSLRKVWPFVYHIWYVDSN